MSRTYRKTSTKQGSPRNWGRRSMAKMDHTKAKKPEPYGIKSGLYELVTETCVVTYGGDNPWWTYNLVKWDIEYVNKGTPLAIQEYSDNKWMQIPTGRWYKKPNPQTISRTYRKYLGPNPEFDWDHSSEVNRQELLFDHVHRNRTGGRSRATERYKKRRKSRTRRLEGKEFLRTYEHEDHIVYEDELSYIDYDQEYYDHVWSAFADTEEIPCDYDDGWDDYPYYYEDYDVW